MCPFYSCLVAVLSLALASASPAAKSILVSAVEPPTLSTGLQFLQAHNEARAAVGLPQLMWNHTLWTEASRYARELRRDCKAARPPLAEWGTDGVYGRNLYMGHGERSGAETAAFWVEGRRWYDRDGNACAAPPGSGRCCGAYTQMVWRDTTQLGCARRVCRGFAGTVAVCEYFPRGNYVGQRPY